MTSRFLVILAAMAILILSVPAQAMDTREFEVISRDQGSVSVTMGKFDFCGLTAVTAGGFNSTCIIQKQGRTGFLRQWIPESLMPMSVSPMVAVPPVSP